MLLCRDKRKGALMNGHHTVRGTSRTLRCGTVGAWCANADGCRLGAQYNRNGMLLVEGLVVVVVVVVTARRGLSLAGGQSDVHRCCPPSP